MPTPERPQAAPRWTETWWSRSGDLGAGTAAMAVAAVGALLGAAVWVVTSTTGDPVGPWWLTVLAWTVISAVRADVVQRWIGGGSTANRPQLRIALGGSLFVVALSLARVPWLAPGAMAVVGVVHTSWSGYRTWRPAATTTLLVAALVEVGVHLRLLPSAASPGTSDTAAVLDALLAVMLLGNAGLVARQRQVVEDDLAAERTRRHADLLHAATHDRLTGLLDREAVGAALERALPGAGPGALVAVLFCDLDGFKAINDTHGHHAGDLVLREVAHRLREVVRPDDAVARVGGDEFLLVLTGLADVEAARQAAARVEAEVAQPCDLGGTTGRVGMSVGLAVASSPATRASALLRSADAEMYRVKGARRASAPGGRAPEPADA